MTGLHTHISAPKRIALSGDPTIDLADLASMVVSLDGPSRDVDAVLEFMIGGDEVIAKAKPRSVIAGKWLSFETPAYTSGGSALFLLAHRRGYRIVNERSGDGFKSTAKCLSSGNSVTAHALSDGVAGVLAIIQLAVMEFKNV